MKKIMFATVKQITSLPPSRTNKKFQSADDLKSSIAALKSSIANLKRNREEITATAESVDSLLQIAQESLQEARAKISLKQLELDNLTSEEAYRRGTLGADLEQYRAAANNAEDISKSLQSRVQELETVAASLTAEINESHFKLLGLEAQLKRLEK